MYIVVALEEKMGAEESSLSPCTPPTLVPGSGDPKCSLLYLVAGPGLNRDSQKPREQPGPPRGGQEVGG